MPKTIEIVGTEPHITYKVGKWAWTVDGNRVLLTKDSGPGIITKNIYQYKTTEEADNAAYRMAQAQSRA